MSDSEWLTYRELAKWLGITPDGARLRARRSKWPTRQEEDGRVWVLFVPSEHPDRSPRTDADRTPERPPDRTSEQATTIKALEDHITTLHEQLTVKDAQLAAKDGLLRARDEEIHRVHVLLQTEQQQVRLLTDQRQRSVSWWWRWFQR